MRLYELVGQDDLRFSPHCWRVRLALAHKRLPADYVPVKFTEKDTIAHSGQGALPVLEDDGKRVIADSWKIAEYLEAAYNDRPSLFDGPASLGLARFVNQWSAIVLQPALARCIIQDIYDLLDPADRDYFKQTREARFGQPLAEVQAGRDRHVEDVRRALAPLASTLKAQRFLSGSQPFYADYIVFSALQWARMVSDFPIVEPGEAGEPIRAWRDRVAALFNGLGNQGPFRGD